MKPKKTFHTKDKTACPVKQKDGTGKFIDKDTEKSLNFTKLTIKGSCK